MLNVAMATFEALQTVKSAAETAAMRGKEIEEVLPFWEQCCAFISNASQLENVKAKQQSEREANGEQNGR